MINAGTIKIIGYVATGIGLAANVAVNWVGEKKMEMVVAEKVAEAITKIQK